MDGASISPRLRAARAALSPSRTIDFADEAVCTLITSGPFAAEARRGE
jgi:hypothetical protein